MINETSIGPDIDPCGPPVVPVDDADHAVFTVVGAVDAQLVQQVQQQHAEVTVKLADGGFEAGV